MLEDVLVESVLGTSLSLGMSLGGVVPDVGGATTGAPGVTQGLSVAQPQAGFLQLQLLSLSSKLGRYELVPQVVQAGAGAGAQPQEGLGAKRAFNLSRKLALAQPQDEATVGPQFVQP